jgi:hypothetical protein
MTLKSKLVQTTWSVQEWFPAAPQLAVIITPELLVLWGRIYALWKVIKILYHFHIVHFSWFCTVFSQQNFAGSSSVKKIRIWVTIFVMVVYLEFWFVVSVRWMKYWFISPLFSIDRRLPLRHPQSRRMVPLSWVAPPWFSHFASGHAPPLWLHGDPRVPWSPIPSIQAWTLQGPRGHLGSPH